MRTSTNIFTAAILVILCIKSVFAVPIPRTKRQNASGGDASAATGMTSSNSTDSSSGSGSGAGSGPWFAVYTDRGPDPAPAVDQIQGFNVVIMSFLLSTGASDMAQAWVSMSASDRTTIKQQYQSAGIKLLVSAFGSTETPTTSGENPQSLAATMAAWVKQYGVDGIDVDYEDTTAMNKGDGKAEQWIIDFTTALRTELPQGQYILTHAPMAPWMGTNPLWKSGAYVTVNKQVGSLIDWYNTQFYNQGPDEYTTCAGLLTTSSSNNPESSVFEIQANGFELNKLVIGKPGSTADASNGQMSTSTLAQCVSQAKGMGWNAGVMSWEYPDANSAWISAVRSSAFPIDGSPGSGSSAPASPTSTANTDPDSVSPTGSVSSTVSGTAGAQPTSASSGDGFSSTSPINTLTTPTSLDDEPTSTNTGTVGDAPIQTPLDGDSSSIVSDTGTGATLSSTPPPTSVDSGSGPTPTDVDSGSSTIAPDSATDEPSVTQTVNNGLWTPTAPTHTFNNGLWTPTANPTGSAIPQRRTSLHEEYSGRRMIRRSRSRYVGSH